MTDAATATNSKPEAAASGATSTDRPGIERKTLKALGKTLPLGVADAQGKLARGFSFKRWRGAEEREVGNLKAQSKEKGDFVSQLLAFMCTQVGEHNFEDMKPEERQIIVSQMHMGDVLYMYVCLRMEAIGNDLKMDLTCPRCSFGFPFSADLNTLEIRCADNLDAAKWTYTLRDEIELRGKKAKVFNMSPIKWSAMEQSIRKAMETGNVNAGLAKMDVIRSCLASIEDHGAMVLTDNELDELTKFDIETLVGKIDGYEVGPDMSVQEKCPRCKTQFRTSLDWAYESFFEISSPS